MELIPLSGEKSTILARLIGRNLAITAWLGSLWLSAGILAIALSHHGYELGAWWVLTGLAGIGALAERLSVPITRNTDASVAFLPFVFTAVAFGPLSAMVVGIIGALIGDFRPPYMRTF